MLSRPRLCSELQAALRKFHDADCMTLQLIKGLLPLLSLFVLYLALCTMTFQCSGRYWAVLTLACSVLLIVLGFVLIITVGQFTRALGYLQAPEANLLDTAHLSAIVHKCGIALPQSPVKCFNPGGVALGWLTVAVALAALATSIISIHHWHSNISSSKPTKKKQIVISQSYSTITLSTDCSSGTLKPPPPTHIP